MLSLQIHNVEKYINIVMADGFNILIFTVFLFFRLYTIVIFLKQVDRYFQFWSLKTSPTIFKLSKIQLLNTVTQSGIKEYF